MEKLRNIVVPVLATLLYIVYMSTAWILVWLDNRS